MTLRLFRRKPGERAGAATQSARGPASSEEPDAPKSRPRRRSSATAKAVPEPVPAPATAETELAAKRARSRRGRRGGVRQRAKREKAEAAKAAAQHAVAPEPIELRPAKDGKRPSNFEELAEAQADTLRGLESSLAAIERRLAALASTEAEQRVGVFVDVPNIMYSAERLKTSIDAEKLLAFLVHGRDLVRASAYAPISDDPQEPIQTQRFVAPFLGHGYRLVTKPLKRFADGTIKANFDIELAIDILTMCDRLDTVVLLSGDSDFRRLVDLVTSKGVRVEVAAFGEATAAELRAAADEYTDLRAHLAELRVK